MTGVISLDPANVVTLLASLLINEKLANIVGPYAVIFLAALGGAGMALGNNKTIATRWAAFWYLARSILFSLLFTVTVSTIVSKYTDNVEAQWLFLPVAFTLSYLADVNRLKAIFNFFGELARVYLRNWVNKGSEQK